MSEQQEGYVDERPITPKSGVRLSVGLIATMLLAFSYFLYARDEYYAERAELKAAAHEKHVEQELATIKASVAGKADKTATIDRFTGKDFKTYAATQLAQDEQFKESVKLWFELVEAKNSAQHTALKERIDHTKDDLRDAIQRIDKHYNMRPVK